jgi:hypothetical protein
MKFRVDGRMYEFDQSRITIKEAMQIKVSTGYGLKAFLEGLEEGDPFSIASIVWLARTRDGETVKFEDVDFNLIDFEADGEEEPDPTRPGETAPGEPPLTSPPSTGE